MDIPETRYATTASGVSIAYQVTGSGPPDIVFVNSSYISNVDLVWEWPVQASLLRGLAARGRLMLFDRRGTGLSDSVSGEHLPTLEARMDDIRAVMDAAGSERGILYGLEDGGALCFLFAATHPDRTEALITSQAVSRGSWAPDAPWLDTEESWAHYFNEVEKGMGNPGVRPNPHPRCLPGAGRRSRVRAGLLAPRPALHHEGRRSRERSDVDADRRAPRSALDPGAHARVVQPGGPQRCRYGRGERLHREPHPWSGLGRARRQRRPRRMDVARL